jgi:hypothetical protein
MNAMEIEVGDDFVNRIISNDAVHENKIPEAYHSIDKCT